MGEMNEFKERDKLERKKGLGTITKEEEIQLDKILGNFMTLQIFGTEVKANTCCVSKMFFGLVVAYVCGTVISIVR